MNFARSYHDVRDAIRDANAAVTDSGKARVVAYINGAGWVHYEPVAESIADAEPEFLCFGLGRIPLPLSETAMDVFMSAVRAEASPS